MELIFALLAGAAVVWYLAKRRAPIDRPKKEKRYVFLEGDDDFGLDVVGESNYQAALDAITGGKTEEGHEFECLAILEREVSNPHDKNAIAVYIENQKVGYLSRQHAKRLSAILIKKRLDGAHANAMIVGGWTRRRGEGHYGVRLDIPTS